MRRAIIRAKTNQNAIFICLPFSTTEQLLKMAGQVAETGLALLDSLLPVMEGLHRRHHRVEQKQRIKRVLFKRQSILLAQAGGSTAGKCRHITQQ